MTVPRFLTNANALRVWAGHPVCEWSATYDRPARTGDLFHGFGEMCVKSGTYGWLRVCVGCAGELRPDDPTPKPDPRPKSRQILRTAVES